MASRKYNKDDCPNKMAAVKRCQSYLVASTNVISMKGQLSEFANPSNKLETFDGRIVWLKVMPCR